MVPVPATVLLDTRGAVPGYRYIKGVGADTGTEAGAGHGIGTLGADTGIDTGVPVSAPAPLMYR